MTLQLILGLMLVSQQPEEPKVTQADLEKSMNDDVMGASVVTVLTSGDLVIFDGAIKHAGRPPNRICYAPRYTMAIKFERVVVGGGA